MLNNAEVVVVAQVDAPGNMGFSMRLGAHIDILNTASGQVILAFQSEEVRARALEIWRRRSTKPIPARLNRHLDEIRRRGYEELRSYQVHGVVNISYPILNQHGQAMVRQETNAINPPEGKHPRPVRTSYQEFTK